VDFAACQQLLKLFSRDGSRGLVKPRTRSATPAGSAAGPVCGDAVLPARPRHSLREICGGLRSSEGKLNTGSPRRAARRWPTPTRIALATLSARCSRNCWHAASPWRRGGGSLR